MITRLKDGDKVEFLPNIEKDGSYGDMIFERYRFCFNQDNKIHLIVDDEKMPIFKHLDKIYWENRNIFQRATKYFAYALLNGEYKIVPFGRAIYMLLPKVKLDENILNVHVKMTSGFPNYSDSYFSENCDPVSNFDFLKKKTVYFDNLFEKNKWTNHSTPLNKFMKENGLPKLEIIIKQEREAKLKRILNEID